MEHSTSSSKVTSLFTPAIVEYSDPSGIYAVISEDIQKHLPLRNLHWNSAIRPLRSIASLHIDLVPAGSANSTSEPPERPNAGALNGSAENANDRHVSQKNRPGSGLGAKKERRHQIPGLRQTPYLKIFFLRCSDLDSYRLTHRKNIREWIKDNTPPTQSTASATAQEFHDAFEWLIVHVILPDDGQSTLRIPNTSKSDVRNGYRGSSAVSEKVRADFNGSSKTAVDRVALVHVMRDSQHGPSQGAADGWEDFISKAKSLILSSFDLRVTQYEEDIKERDSQRNIPGWNFNTFFVLKEGLARGFESVGLIEDALTGYRELAVGLNSILKSSAIESQHGGHFRDFTNDLSTALRYALQTEQPQEPHELKNVHDLSDMKDNYAVGDRKVLGANILDADRKPFRELILANEISVFDFQCYLFAREASLLLRLANASEPSKFGKSTAVDNALEAAYSHSQDPLLLAEVCRRATDFFSIAGRIMRDDLRSSIHPLSKSHSIASPTTLSTFEGPIEDIIASWTYSACQCILDATNVPSIESQLQPLLRNLKPSNEAYASPIAPSPALSPQELPRRTSSLPVRTHTGARPSSPNELPSVTSLDAVRLLPPTSSQTGAHDLAAEQAGLVTLKRRVMANIGHRSNKVGRDRVGLPGTSFSSAHDMEDISLDDASTTSDQAETGQDTSQRSSDGGIQNRELGRIVRSESAFSLAYEDLTIMALALNVLGDRRSRMKDYSSAASYFHQLASFYYNSDWTRLELPMLDLYAQCLKHLGRTQDFCRTGLQILAKTTNRRYVSAEVRSHHKSTDGSHYLQDTINASKSLSRPVSAPLHQYFSDVYLDPYIQHCGERDGFCMYLKLRSLMLTAVEAQEIRVRIGSIDEEQYCDLWLTSESPQLLQPGISHVQVRSNITCPAWYRLERVDVRSANIVFFQDAKAPSDTTFPDHFSASDHVTQVPHADLEPILVWPDEEALEAKLSLSPFIHLGKIKSIEILISSGRNNISHGRLCLRACSAGLRLHTGEADTVTGECPILDKPQAGSLEFGSFETSSKSVIRIPYSLEDDLAHIKVKLEIFYIVDHQEYQYNCTSELRIQLPLSVNVQDNFQEYALFSNFRIDTAKSVPTRISDCMMHSTDTFEVSMPPLSSNTLIIFARQPLSLVARIRRKKTRTSDAQTSTHVGSILMLQIRCACIDQEVSTAVADKLSTALRQSEFRDLRRLLVNVLCKVIRSKLSLHDLESIGLLGGIHMAIFEQDLWQSVLSGLRPERREKAASWLTEWQAANAMISLPESTDARDMLELNVPVEVPRIPIVVTGHLDVLSCGGGVGESRFAAMDQSLLAELCLRYSRYWANEPGGAAGTNSVCISYEVQASADVWLIGGQRKGQFSAMEGEVSKFPIILLPQKTGHLLYPSVEVRVSEGHGHGGGREEVEEAADGAVECEMDYLDQSESILIIPDLGSSTVSLDCRTPGGAAWLLESNSRLERRKDPGPG
ncbi:MAG: hypothetical protein Q9200_005579 [Gallowayella weberi]